MTPERRRLRWALSLLVPLGFLHLLVFVRIPLDVYAASAVELTSAAEDIVAVLAITGLASLAALTLLLAATTFRIAGDVRVWLLALALTAWCVDSFFGRSYPLFDGTVQRIEPDRLRLVLEITVLIALIYVLSRWQRRLEAPALLFVGLLTLFNAASIVSRYGELTATEPASPSTPVAKPEFALSTERNVLVIVLDTFQSDFFEDVLARDPDLAGRLDGFVFYPDTLGVAPTTFLSLPAIHSGRRYDPERSMSGYFERSVRDSSFMSGLAAAGYRTLLVNPIRQLCPAGVHCVMRDELIDSRRETAIREALYLLDVALMRVAPESLKDWTFNRGSFRVGALVYDDEPVGDARLVRDDDRLLARLTDRLQARAGAPSGWFVHLMNTHPPYVLDEDCDLRDTAGALNRESAIRQATCALRRVGALLDEMRDAGTFDPSLIIVVGDHGFASPQGRPDLGSTRLTNATADVSARLAGKANPLLLIKPPDAGGPWRQDFRPAALTDVAATICARWRDCEIPYGNDLLGNEPRRAEPRLFLSYAWEHRFWDLGYIPSVDFYEVLGPLAEPGSWSRQPLGLRRRRIERIEAGSEGDMLSVGAGFASPEPDPNRGSKRWVIGRDAQLLAQLQPDPRRHVAYQVDLEFYTPPFVTGQAVSLAFNGTEIARRPLDNRLHVVSFRLPATLARPGYNRIDLSFEKSAAPGGGDDRPLATSFFSATLSEVERRADRD